ncbi:hypothetical protein DLAC_06517 [Tieghemostelium lacteum]|uniref:Uncharacterized protein n=1 Tax=Tieghemostelium lacteum TaxID=361077 RepID=A0A151ZEY7_TIELA|nr:hypothetical protein DLAC_06517 [Tieghemostelium lacteum]|eukprot:KYQ92526.1 hypothetical protein DLAC_06517 [Tieghemostelium lacteum]
MKKNHSHNNMVIFSDDDVYFLDEMIYKPSIAHSGGGVLQQQQQQQIQPSIDKNSSKDTGLVTSSNGFPLSISNSLFASTNSATSSSSSSNVNNMHLSSPLNSSQTSDTGTLKRNSSKDKDLSQHANSNTKKHFWPEEEQNDFHHFDISFPPLGNRIFYAGEKVEVHLKVNVKKLQFLMATFECISTSHKTHNLEKKILYSEDIHLYPTDKDLVLKQNQRNSMPLLPIPTSPTSSVSSVSSGSSSIHSGSTQATINSNSNNSGSTAGNMSSLKSPLSRETVIPIDLNLLNLNSNSNGNSGTTTKGPKSQNSNTQMRKSISAGDYYSTMAGYESSFGSGSGYAFDDDECSYLEPLPEFEENSIYQPPVVHSCSEHQVITNRKHKFIFRFSIPTNSIPSFAMHKDMKNGVFYRLAIKGLGELHGSKFNSEGPMIKGIQTYVPLTVKSTHLSYLPRELFSVEPETFIYTSQQPPITIKSRMIFRSYAILNSNITIHLTIENQSNSLIKGFKFELFNIQKSWLLNSNINAIDQDTESETNNVDNNNNNNNNNSKNTEHSSKKEKDKEKEKEKEKDKKLKDSGDGIDLDDDNIKLCCNSSTVVSHLRFKSADKHILAKSKYQSTISFSIPGHLTPSIYLANLLNTYTLKITLRKHSNCFVELPIILLPVHPPN